MVDEVSNERINRGELNGRKDQMSSKNRYRKLAEDEPMVVSEQPLTYGEVAQSLVGSHLAPGSFESLAPSQVVSELRAGIPIRQIDELKEALDISLEALAGYLDISKATLHRQIREQKTMSTQLSDRALRYARLFGLAAATLESPDAARAWLKSPQAGLGGEVPLEFARTETGAREVESLLGRIEFGVYS